jgi:predicted DNA-binding transcriptional regulator AlpA
MGDDELLTCHQAGQLLKVSATTLWRMRRDGRGPVPVHVGKDRAKRPSWRYRRSQVLEFIHGGSHE